MAAPFTMKASRGAQLRCDGKWITTGRASFVWETLLMRRASGVPGVHEVRACAPGAPSKNPPWHRVDLTIEEAEEALRDWGMFGTRRVRLARRVRANRAERGLEVA